MISVSCFPTSHKYNSFHIAAETEEEKKQRLKDYGEKQKEAREKDLEKLNESPLRFYDTINLFLTDQQDEKYIAYEGKCWFLVSLKEFFFLKFL